MENDKIDIIRYRKYVKKLDEARELLCQAYDIHKRMNSTENLLKIDIIINQLEAIKQ